MGWGVEQQETFAQIIEARTGLTVLNATVSSYGTAREIMSLKRLNSERMRFLVIQYSNNDSVGKQGFLREQESAGRYDALRLRADR